MTRIRPNRAPVVVVAAFALAAALTGCAGGDSRSSSDPMPTATSTSTMEPTPTPPTTGGTSAASAVHTTGDVLDEAEFAAWCDDPSTSDDSLYYYPLPDGRYVVTDPDEPLPALVTADIQARLDAIGVDTATDNGAAAIDNFEEEKSLQADVLGAGKSIVTLRLRSMAVPHDDGSVGGMRWVATAVKPAGWWMQWETDRDTLASNVAAWVSQNTTPGSWVVFVGPGSRIAPGP
ncbi:hypothetical protein [Protaetiibacter mangrovi]|uniref:Uncharacterized protein n=1 Tax=Protaetiibacter mangrovi TaxID=2970926 RepID=A0ABT1ZE18_9MICO|nr:hypothetical protein [Protaetiibacter mangrovi]MCS0498925.1 hypothetical protein [Protaetiibacter mangrovi]